MKPSGRAALLLMSWLPALAHAGSDDDERRARSGKTAVAIRAVGGIAIDGRLDDATWKAARFVDDFAQKVPDQDAAATERTEVAIAFDGDALYVAARMHVADVSRLDRPMTRRDDSSGAERIIVSLDPYRSRRTAYSFSVTAAGVRVDYLHTDDSERDRDYSWNPVWSAAVQVGADAWTAELRIPLSQLRFPDDATPVWGINFNRFVPRSNEDDFWIVVPRDRTGWASYFGELRGLDGLDRRIRLELLPYLAGDLHVRSPDLFEPGDPFADTFDPGGNAGLDLKLGLGPALTLDATVNPDFGQVEADPAVVNLGAFEVTFPERRPFFIEGAQILASQPRAYFYSRRIGAPPRVVPDAPYLDQPDAARILGAAKLTGQIAPHVNVGALAAVTAPTRASVGDDAGATRRALVAPLTGWGVLRVEREGDGGNLAGFTLTGVSRTVADPLIRAELPRAAVTGGLDARWRLDGGRYQIFAALGGSAVAGSPAAIGAVQRASARYLQRPDADHVALDPDATVLTGWHADVEAAKRAGLWRFDVGGGAESPGLELNELGTLQSSDDLEAFVQLSRVDTTPSRHLQGWELALFDLEEWNFGGVHKPGYTEVELSATLPSFLGINAKLAVHRPGLSDDATRGGPLMELGWGIEGGASISSSNTGRLSWSVDAGAEASRTDATGVEVGGSLLWRVIDRLRFQIAPTVQAGTIASQYVGALADTGGGADTFGTRYLFASLDLRQVSTQVRAQLSLSPDLTIDGYVEPFASSGRFHRFGELAAPRGRLRRYDDVSRADGQVTVDDAGDRFTLGDPDFTVLSLRSTVVLRWELRPGSVLFAVWQQDRSSNAGQARGLRPGLFGDVVTAPGEHVLAVKLSWWISP